MQFIDTVTAFEQKHFDRSTMTVAPHAVDIKAALGFDLTDDEVMRLSGAPSGSMIRVFHQVSWPAIDADEPPPGVYFEIQNAGYIRSYNVAGLFVDDPSIPTYGLYLKLIDFDPRGPRRMAARMLAIIVRQAMLIRGLTRLRLLAAGGRSWDDLDPSTGERWGGYYAWPRYGFDAPLLQRTIDISMKFPYYPKALSTCKTVSEVLQLQGGTDYWKSVGDGTFMEFDLSSPTTPSIRALDSVLGKEGI